MNNQNPNSIEEIIGYHFKDQNLLTTALTHRSCLGESNTKESYERLEFLGDAVLEMLISVHLFNQYPDKQEGYLTAARSAIVRTESLFKISIDNNINKYILMSKGEESTGGRNNPSILEDVIESLIGALYSDGGIEAARGFFEKFVIPKADTIITENKLKDPKSTLQERIQAQGLSSPVYQTIKEYGPDHEKTFEVSVIINNKPIAIGTGKNKQLAEQKAAQKALELI